MENINELKHKILDCANYFGWKVIFNGENILHIHRMDGEYIIEYWNNNKTYEDVEDTFNIAINDELSQMTFPEPLPEYKFQMEHFFDLAKYFEWIIDINCAIGNNMVTIWNKQNNSDYNYCIAYKGRHISYVVDLVMNEELKKMGLQ